MAKPPIERPVAPPNESPTPPPQELPQTNPDPAPPDSLPPEMPPDPDWPDQTIPIPDFSGRSPVVIHHQIVAGNVNQSAQIQDRKMLRVDDLKNAAVGQFVKAAA